MYDTLIGNWWALALRGLAAILFGLLALLVPGLTLGVLVTLFALYALVDGALALLVGARARQADPHARLLAGVGVAGVAVGTVTLLWPGITAFVLLLLVAAWALATGALQLAVAAHLRRAGHGDWLLGVAGLLALALGLGVIVFPAVGASGFVWWLAAFALAFGGMLLVLALRLRALGQGTTHESGMIAAA